MTGIIAKNDILFKTGGKWKYLHDRPIAHTNLTKTIRVTID